LKIINGQNGHYEGVRGRFLNKTDTIKKDEKSTFSSLWVGNMVGI
jgi:hypothetical protein